MSRRKQAKPRSVKAVDEGEGSEFTGSWESPSVHTDVTGPDRDAEQKERRAGLEDGDQSVTSHDDRVCEDDLDDESIFTCDNCQQDFECLAELTEHRTHHCPAVFCLSHYRSLLPIFHNLVTKNWNERYLVGANLVWSMRRWSERV
ncbi:hypothetical protein SKAU_G00388390 [Synaphobranchus kaupii]|uniref:C2H2-type domain-containing protein n=1 Tax=Synaphobranchus kaupii TaxID=118154 RepID=A0A9Q1EB43_SYNKA|nr:hypothetical protein SKAU_G00388390 [Synaphobranchus kaupii]